MKKITCTALNIFFGLSALVAPTIAQDGLTIPSGHPRLYWTPARITQAQAWYAAHPFTPTSPDSSGFNLNEGLEYADDALQHAFIYVLTGNAANARNAITGLMSYIPPNALSTDIGSDNSRWYGEDCILIYDWCHDQMTALERDTIINRWNPFLDSVRLQTWGGVGMEGNNYYWGNLRNEFEWGVATWGENPMAQVFLDNGLVTRWQNSFLPYAAGAGRGGVPAEGTTYGSEMTESMIIPSVSVALMGRDLMAETNFYREFVYYLVYGSTPDSTFGGGDAGRVFELFPFDDLEYPDKRDIFGTTTAYSYRTYWGDALIMFSNKWAKQPAGQYARRLINLIHPAFFNIYAALDSTVPEKDFSALPLDYYAPGMSYLFARNKWGIEATSLFLQLGVPKGEGHQHMDAGSFQIWRKSRWASRETAGYSNNIAGINGVDSQDVMYTLAHNMLYFDSSGQYSGAPKKGDPVTLRVESNPAYAYAAVDLTETYKLSPDFAGRGDPEAPVSSIEREFLFIRPLEALVVLDRLGPSPQASKRIYLLHSEQNFTIQDSSHALTVNGDQALRLTVLKPQGQAAPSYRVVNEGGTNSGGYPVGQYRLQVTTNTADSSYFITILQARDSSAGNLTATMTEDNASFRITLVHPTQGSAAVVFQKGMQSNGGSFAFAASGTPSNFTNLLGRVQGIQVTDNGPEWENLNASAGKPGQAGNAVSLECRPNPFNPAANISFVIGAIQESPVHLTIYNTVGKLIVTLLNQPMSPGKHAVIWNAAGYPSGVYVVRLQTGKETMVKRLLLMK